MITKTHLDRLKKINCDVATFVTFAAYLDDRMNVESMTSEDDYVGMLEDLHKLGIQLKPIKPTPQRRGRGNS